jgi:hypothetical protein
MGDTSNLTIGANYTIAIGTAALNSLTSGANNFAIGKDAAKTITTAQQNLAIGRQALETHLTGESNIAIGYLAMGDTDAGTTSQDSDFNVFIGLVAGGGAWINAKSRYNVGVGQYTMAGAMDGALGNVAMGYQSLNALEEGDYNTTVGYRAGLTIAAGANNTCIGANAGASIITGHTNVCLGYGAEPTSADANESITLGDSSISVLRCNDTTISSLSDERDKTDIVDNEHGLEFINKLKTRQFKWQTRRGNTKDGKTRIGFIAQELLEVMDGSNDILDLVYDVNPEYLEAKIANIVTPLVKAVQELSAKVEALEAQVSGSS